MLTDANGNPIKQSTPPEEGVDLVQCTVLVENIINIKASGPIPVTKPGGRVLVDFQGLVANIAMNLYSIMQHTKQKELIIRLVDLSSEMVAEKNLSLTVLELVSPEIKEDE